MNDKNNETIHLKATVDVIIMGSGPGNAVRLRKVFNNQFSMLNT